MKWKNIKFDDKWFFVAFEIESDGVAVQIIPDIRRDMHDQLQLLVMDEKYEEAAQLRDLLKELNYENC